MRDFIKHALTKTIQVRTAHGDTQQLELPPNKKLLYGMYFALAALITYTVGFGKRRHCSNVVVPRSRIPTTFKLLAAWRQSTTECSNVVDLRDFAVDT
jgi:hypothetical protein